MGDKIAQDTTDHSEHEPSLHGTEEGSANREILSDAEESRATLLEGALDAAANRSIATDATPSRTTAAD